MHEKSRVISAREVWRDALAIINPQKAWVDWQVCISHAKQSCNVAQHGQGKARGAWSLVCRRGRQSWNSITQHWLMPEMKPMTVPHQREEEFLAQRNQDLSRHRDSPRAHLQRSSLQDQKWLHLMMFSRGKIGCWQNGRAVDWYLIYMAVFHWYFAANSLFKQGNHTAK